MRNRFDEQLATLNKELIEMGALCEEAIAIAAKALTTADKTAAEKVDPLESEINQKERDIETLCLKMLLQQQPVAKDLRQISAALKLSDGTARNYISAIYIKTGSDNRVSFLRAAKEALR